MRSSSLWTVETTATRGGPGGAGRDRVPLAAPAPDVGGAVAASPGPPAEQQVEVAPGLVVGGVQGQHVAQAPSLRRRGLRPLATGRESGPRGGRVPAGNGRPPPPAPPGPPRTPAAPAGHGRAARPPPAGLGAGPPARAAASPSRPQAPCRRATSARPSQPGRKSGRSAVTQPPLGLGVMRPALLVVDDGQVVPRLVAAQARRPRWRSAAPASTPALAAGTPPRRPGRPARGAAAPPGTAAPGRRGRRGGPLRQAASASSIWFCRR